jgi:hypothetical protein
LKFLIILRIKIFKEIIHHSFRLCSWNIGHWCFLLQNNLLLLSKGTRWCHVFIDISRLFLK